MQVIPLAADSLGVRSMATLVVAGGTRVLIDPGAALAATRHGAPPSPEERAALDAATERIIGALCLADAVVVTHYHEDHANLLPYVLSSSAILVKQPGSPGERRAAAELLPAPVRSRHAYTECLRSKERIRNVTLEFSPPFSHGKPGGCATTVAAVAVTAPQGRFVFASDAQGLLEPEALAWVAAHRPDLVYVSGIPTYRVGLAADNPDAAWNAGDVAASAEQLHRLLQATGCQVILDHHLVREPHYRRSHAALFAGGRVRTAAGFLGTPERLLEAQRHQSGIQEPLPIESPAPAAVRWTPTIETPALAAVNA